ncbi:MAG: Na-K-Cl cotransporter [Polyangiaceae bacterium]|nr:Na-K-Cl cotransporter [Polyangiaceae bacterium]
MAQDTPAAGRFGTFAGVFTPSILTILGVVMYLRFGWVVGNAGLGGALLIVVVAHVITLCTGLSISTIATNRTVGAGGAYYMISRSLGAPAGAAIGIPLFLGQALSVSFYVVGFVESLEMLVPHLPTHELASVVCIGLAILSIKSAEVAMKVQFGVMVIIALSLVSFFTGTGDGSSHTMQWDAPKGAERLGTVFAVFFPAVTGIMAGLGMSGDLKDSRRSLPRGTLFAILVGFIVYMAFPVWLALHVSSEQLLSDNKVVWTVSRFQPLIYLGIWGATLSSAIGSLLTAPRTLQAIAQDGLVPRVLGKGHGQYNEPRFAMALTFVIAMAGIWLGNLDAIANTLTMFFLATYGLTNLACALELWAASPSFRPDFKVPWWLSFFGAVACFYVMSIIDLLQMFAALFISGVIYAVTQRRVLGTTYGDARHGIWSALVRTSLHHLRHAEFHPLNWRPNLVVMAGQVERRPYLLELGSTIVQDSGVVTYFQLVKGDVAELAGERRRLLKEIDAEVAARYPNVFYRVDVVDDVHRGVVTAAQSYGLGSFESNTVLLGWPKSLERYQPYLHMLRDLVALDRSLLMVDYKDNRGFGQYQYIDVWWGGLQGNGGLMLLLAFLITAQDRWAHAEVRVMTVVNTKKEYATAEKSIKGVLNSSRVRAQPHVIMRDGKAIGDIMRDQSASADLAIIGIRLPDPSEPETESFERIRVLLGNLPTTILVYSARDFPGEPVLFQS